ncbi:MAG: hypothetical protein VX090_09785, partial [Pseudomonadota bacterium]|nr:hypothetical protein [Pseudomonadota bacterium]
VTSAYVKHVPHIDRPPGPMLDNYEQRIASDEAFVATNTEFISGVIILIEAADHLLFDNIAVDLAMQDQNRRSPRRFRRSRSAASGIFGNPAFTHVMMDANVACYESLGWEETHRGEQNGYAGILICKRFV